MGLWIESSDWHEKVAERMSEILEEVAVQIEADAKAGAPVDTGDLKASIDHEVVGRTARIGSNLDYAGWVEDGHRVAYRGADGETVFTGETVPPQPYLRPALYRTREL